MTAFAPLLQAFFTDRLMTQYGASPHTIASYRDAFKLLLGYVHQQTGTLPARLDLVDLDAATIGGFLQHLETVRGNSIATRNTRLAAIHSLFRYASLQVPEHADLIGRVLAIQTKRTTTTIVTFLDRVELDALLAAPDPSTWHGRRDHALLVVASRADRTAGLRAHRLGRRRRAPRHRPARALPGQGPQGSLHATDQPHRERPDWVARRAWRGPDRAALLHPDG